MMGFMSVIIIMNGSRFHIFRSPHFATLVARLSRTYDSKLSSCVDFILFPEVSCLLTSFNIT
jgi:hypothetical protein